MTQTDGLGKVADDSRMRWLPPGEVPDARPLVPGRRLRHPLRRQVAHQPRRPASTRPPGRRGRHQRRRRRGRPDGGPGLPRRRPARRRTASRGWVGPEPHGAALANSGLRRDPLTRRPGRRLARGPLRPPGRRRRRGAPAVPAGGQLREPARHRAVPGLVRGASRSQPGRSTRRLCPRRRPSTRTWRPSRPPRSPSGPPTPRATGRRAAIAADLRAKSAQAYRDLYLPAARRGRRPRSTGSAGRSPTGSHDTPCWCAPPTTASCSAPTAACTRSGSTSTTRRPGCRSAIARIGAQPTVARGGRTPDVARRPRPDAARRRPASTCDAVADELRAALHRGPPAARAST